MRRLILRWWYFRKLKKLDIAYREKKIQGQEYQNQLNFLMTTLNNLYPKHKL